MVAVDAFFRMNERRIRPSGVLDNMRYKRMNAVKSLSMEDAEIYLGEKEDRDGEENILQV